MALVGLELERKMMTAAVKARRPSLCIGETGTGKTTLAREVLSEYCPAGVLRINLNGGTTPDELEGRFQLRNQETYFQHGVLVEAMQRGMGVILDELNAALPDTLFVIHAALEQPPRLHIPETGETIEPHPDFCVVATMNPSHDYAGTKGLNLALYSRFAAVIRFQPLTGDRLLKAIMSHHPTAPTELVLKVVDVIDKLTKLRNEEKLTTPIGIREALAVLTFATDGLTVNEAIITSISHKLELSERDAVAGISLLQVKEPKGWGSLEELLVLAKDAAVSAKKVSQLEKRLEKLKGIITALKDAGCDVSKEEP